MVCKNRTDFFGTFIVTGRTKHLLRWHFRHNNKRMRLPWGCGLRAGLTLLPALCSSPGGALSNLPSRKNLPVGYQQQQVQDLPWQYLGKSQHSTETRGPFLDSVGCLHGYFVCYSTHQPREDPPELHCSLKPFFPKPPSLSSSSHRQQTHAMI